MDDANNLIYQTLIIERPTYNEGTFHSLLNLPLFNVYYYHKLLDALD